MPPIPRWYGRLPTIRRKLQDWPVDAPIFRKSIVELFGVKARQANKLMSKVPGYASSPHSHHRHDGRRHSLTRSALLEMLDELAAPGGLAAAKIQEKKDMASFFIAEERKVRPQKIPPPPPKPVSAALPAGMRLIGPGQLLTEYSSPEELLSLHMALSHSAVADFASFAASVEYVPPRDGDCTVDDSPNPPSLGKGEGDTA